MELFAVRGHFFCRYCGSFDFPPTAGTDGIRVLDDANSTLPCGVCSKPLAVAVLDAAHQVRYCRNCRGVLMARSTFAAVVHARRAWTSEPPAPPVPLDRGELARKIVCPECRSSMAVHPYYGPGNVVMDSCERCNAVWLDFGELRQITDAPGADRGRRDGPAPGGDDTLARAIVLADRSGFSGSMGSRGRYAGDLLDLLFDLF